MTNFTNCLKEKGIMQISGGGYERYDILEKCYDDYQHYPDNFIGMQDMMKQVWFSKAFTTPIDSKELWLTEFADEDLPAETLYGHYELLEIPELRELALNYITVR